MLKSDLGALSPKAKLSDRKKVRTIAPLNLIFKDLQTKYDNRNFLFSDPVQFIHKYPNPNDQELVGLISSLFSYGDAKQIIKTLNQVLFPLGANPFKNIQMIDFNSHWNGFYYRFHTEHHLRVLLRVIQECLNEFGTLGLFYQSFANKKSLNNSKNFLEHVLESSSQWFHERIKNHLKSTDQTGLWRGLRFLFNLPSTGGACKRHLMYFRWMTRQDNIDLGLWSSWIKPAQLFIPVDTHIGRISYYLNLRKGAENRPPNWKMSCEITKNLRRLNPDDPVSYDFGLTRLGILDICQKKYSESICSECPVALGCRYTK